MSNEKQKNLSRRELMQLGTLLIPGLSALALTERALAQGAAAPAAGAAACAPIPATDPVATALKYVADGSKAVGRVAKMGVEAKDQACSNCALYVKHSTVKGAELGKCTMLSAGCVASKGWCTAWVKKA